MSHPDHWFNSGATVCFSRNEGCAAVPPSVVLSRNEVCGTTI